MNPLSPYLNVDPRYLVQDTDEFILPTGANKTRGRFELAFFTIGGCCMTGAAFGAMNGLRLGLKETQNMAWSKPRNVQILNMVTRQGALWANTLGSLGKQISHFIINHYHYKERMYMYHEQFDQLKFWCWDVHNYV